ncbi:MAG: TatA/E family twin arginine-targeting protein translocase [Cyanobacteriota bacterium]|nr:TatA/E family twin arginine-targeting protein translocase [Cyanobacteriota bacterium]
MNVFGIGIPEMVVILVIALLVFGPKKLPEIGSSLGKAIKGFQNAARDFESEFQREAKQIEEKPSNKSEPEPVITVNSKEDTNASSSNS